MYQQEKKGRENKERRGLEMEECNGTEQQDVMHFKISTTFSGLSTIRPNKKSKMFHHMCQ